jgi:hypothetical protein
MWPGALRWVALCWLWLTTSALGHPLHLSTGEAVYRAETCVLEVSLTLFADDLEAAAGVKLPEQISAEIETKLAVLVQQDFRITLPDGADAKLSWVGAQWDAESKKSASPCVLLHFTVTLPSTGLEGCTVSNALLMKLLPEQRNYLYVEAQGRKLQLCFTKDKLAHKW